MTKHTSYITQLLITLKKLAKAGGRRLARFWRKNIWHKLMIILAGLFVAWLGMAYGIARWYIATSNDKPLIVGSSFIPAYAESLGLDPRETMDALVSDVGVRHFRLVSYWNQMEPEDGRYDFSQLDWQFEKAEAAGAKVSLSLGLRQPRWPECHMPQWAAQKEVAVWQQDLLDYVAATVNRYKDSPALDSYQVENEFFLKGFGNCEHIPGAIDRERFVAEYDLVKRLDPDHKAIINRSNNALGWPIGDPQPDEFGLSIYKRVWGNPPGRYVEYPFPAWYYGFLAGWQKIMTGRDMMIHELQAEAWGPGSSSLTDISLEEQNKSFNAERFAQRFEFGKATGMREMYLWSGEYWYYRLIKENDTTVWNTAKDIFKEAESSHQ
jgi:hypothetical protein